MKRSIFSSPQKYELRDQNFSYANLCKLKDGERLTSKEYSYTAKKDSGHIFLLRKEEKPGDLVFSRSRGYKFHISIDTSNSENLANAWNIIFTILDKNSLHQFKILHSDSEAKHTRGKEITIFAFQNRITAEQWQVIINELTEALANANINPSALPGSDNHIPNTNYVSYRNDGGNQYTEDPFANLKIECKVKQPERITPPQQQH